MHNNKIGNYRWVICGLLFFATTINYLDRQVLSLLHPILEKKFNWTNSDYANITATFQFVYALSMLFAGGVVDKLGTKWGYAVSIMLWSIAALVHAVAIPLGGGVINIFSQVGINFISISVTGFVVSRALLGIGEAGNFPVPIKATAEYFPKKERALATGVFNSGANVGAILAPLTVPYIADKLGWEITFIYIGIIGFIWLIFWFYFYDKPEKQKRLSQTEYLYIHSDKTENQVENIKPTTVVKEKPKWLQLLKYKQTWSFAIGKFLTDGVWWFFLFWLPSYLKSQYHLNAVEIAMPLTVLYSMTMIGSIGGGWLPMHFIKKGYEIYKGRMRAMLIIAVIPLIVLFAQTLGVYGYWLPVLFIGIGASAHQAWSANIFTTVSNMFPKKMVASVVGIGGMAGGIGGVIISKIGGYLFDYYKTLGHIETGYSIMFTFCAIAYLLAWSIMNILVPKHQNIVL